MKRLGESIDNINQLTLTIETPFNLANFQLEEIQSIIRTYFYDIDSINDINRNINNDIIRCNDLKEIV